MTAPGRYLAKARESLASAQADLGAGRANSSAARAYYAAFQAAVSMLIAEGVHPRRGNWDHKFVMTEFSGRLVSSRRIISSRFRNTLQTLFDVRVIADYQERDVSRTQARRAVRAASELLGEIESKLR
ncbi:MAG: HEPN domain-containing protein [Dehalococcoidia bacterium]|nr:HEPN domain-containing protein [Dehalococcoidia bacterium]